ncbi:hypothetical protein QCN29_15080 [Streptomyces sp. HNM0663]|uniref:Uncharacterized protein n=1 Tax=Streptomyces chengmaiensis TaxID=3040919 RepID=A0ABT6HP35_9ACTN|nr:hypothetical protein [Streptomyces chengmaiensis]MDH2390091.1 hypothetical protein [Streptomyces chengmaiensis]
MTPCTVVETETETEPYDLGLRRAGYVIVRATGGERRRVSAEKVSVEPDEA